MFDEQSQLSARTRAAIAALLFAVAITLAGCSGSSTGGGEGASAPAEAPETAEQQPEQSEEGSEEENPYAEEIAKASEEATPNPENLEGPPEMKEWNDPTIGEGTPNTAQFFNTGGSAGAIPAVKPFNFGRDPGGPEDKTMYVSVPKIGLDSVEVINSTSEEALTESTVHVPATGFPWQEGANTYIAGHRIGYEGTGSFEVFYDLDQLAEGDEITVADSEGNQYIYRVFNTLVTDPFDVEVMNPEEGREIVTLQTCTLPDYRDRIVVQGELVEGELVA